MDPRAQRQIARINELSALARASWIGLLAYLAFVFVTLLGVEDADFFVPSRQTQLPLVNVSIPTASFFIFAPILAAALYVYLHLFLIKLWDAIAEAPATVRTDPEHDERIPLSEAIHPWLVNDLACAIKGGGARPTRPLGWLAFVVTFGLVWLAGPGVIFGLWLVSTKAHDERLTLLIAAALWFALLAMFASMAHALGQLRHEPLKFWHRAYFIVLLSANAAVFAHFSWRFTEGGFERYAPAALRLWHGGDYDRLFRSCDSATQDDCRDSHGWTLSQDMLEERRIAALPWLPITRQTEVDGFFGPSIAFPDLIPIHFSETALVPLPSDWRDWDVARMDFRETWCRREGLSMDVCDHRPAPGREPPPHVATQRTVYCSEQGIADGAPCDAHFAKLDACFDEEWNAERISVLTALPALDLSGRDLRGAYTARASLVNANLYKARLEGAELSGVRLEGADLSEARLDGASLVGARLEGAQISGARLERANLSAARLEEAKLVRARLAGANLSQARLVGANLSRARLEGARLDAAALDSTNLYVAKLNAANLAYATLRSAYMRGADLSDANLYDADLTGANLGDANLSGAVLINSDLVNTDLNGASIAGANLAAARLVEATLIDADLSGADLSGSDLTGAILWGARATGVDWSDASIEAVAPWADLRGSTGLSQAQLDGVIGNRATLLPDGLAPDTRRPFTIWDCWLTPPADFDHALAALIGAKYDNEAEARADLVCPSGEAPTPRGVPCALDLTPEQCLDPESNPLHPMNRSDGAIRLVPAPAAP